MKRTCLNESFNQIQELVAFVQSKIGDITPELGE